MAYAIQTMDGEHLGFLLMSGSSEKGDCIFRSLPNKPENFNLPESEFLFEIQNMGEFAYIKNNEVISFNNSKSGQKAVMENSELKIENHLYKVVEIGT